ncbi:hypothetical protein GPK41_09295, partial [Bifidobacterium adolescentis]|uniref:phosphorylase family protein n=1 Tax=Bifidobacterium adolescentis TaxID=1680 RepID=UPI001C014197
MARREMMGLLMVMGLLLAMVPDTMQRAVNLPVQAKTKPLLVGLILSTTSDETLLLESGDYVPKYTTKKAGRTFNVGSFHGVPVVYVIAVAPLAHVSATAQILLDSFKVVGLIDYSNSATVNPSLKLGDVAVLSETAFTSTWTWEDYKSMVNSVQATELPTLKIGEYNVPEAGDNKLGSIEFVN